MRIQLEPNPGFSIISYASLLTDEGREVSDRVEIKNHWEGSRNVLDAQCELWVKAYGQTAKMWVALWPSRSAANWAFRMDAGGFLRTYHPPLSLRIDP